MIYIPSKTCRTCELRKPLAEFYLHAHMADGYLSRCIQCCREYAQAKRDARRKVKQ